MSQKLRTIILFQKSSPGGWHPSHPSGLVLGGSASVCLIIFIMRCAI